MLNKDMFFKLIRRKDKDQEEFFDEASKIYLGMVNQKREDATVQ